MTARKASYRWHLRRLRSALARAFEADGKDG